MLAPEVPIVAVRDGGIPNRFDKEAFPAEVGAAVLPDVGQPRPFTRWLHDHAFPRTASSNARFTATRANCTL